MNTEWIQPVAGLVAIVGGAVALARWIAGHRLAANSNRERVVLSPNQEQIVRQLFEAEKRSAQPFMYVASDQRALIVHPELTGGELPVSHQDVVALDHEGFILFSNGSSNGNQGGEFGLTSKARQSAHLGG